VTIEVTGHPAFDSPPPKKQRTYQRRPGPKHPNYGIPPAHWPDVIRRVEQGESLRQVGEAYNVSYETIRRVLKAARKQEEGGR
jgi:hypothetical protein